jgi:hypothetical protein
MDFEERRRLGIGKFLDSTVIEKRINIVGALTEAPQLRVDKAGKIWFASGATRCLPLFLVDRQVVDEADVRLLNINLIAAMEIYPRGFMIPSELWGPKGMPGCVVAIWTKMYFP